jgi:hypothetical protein
MFSRLFRILFHTAVYIAIFLGLVWLLLGIPPQEALTRSRDNLRRLFGQADHFAGDFKKTAGDMKEVADYHLQEANDRLHGIDPYTKLAKKLDESMKPE